MKKRLLLLIATLLIPISVNAATGSIKVSSSSSKVTLNNNVTVTVTVSSTDTLGSWQFNLNYDKKKLSIQSGQNDLSVADVSRDGSYKTTKYTYKFKAIATGSANISIENAKIGDWTTDSYISTSSNNITLEIKEPVIINYSSDNNLKSLSIDGFTISPEFNKSTLEYTSKVDANTTKIRINATANDSKAKVTGTGEKDVIEGINSFQIVVTAENGSSKTYTLNVTVPEKDPIKYTFKVKEPDIASKMSKNVNITYAYKTEEYTILRKLPENIPLNFNKSTIKFNEEEVSCLQNQDLNLTLIYLRDKNNNENFYVYDSSDDSVTLYNEIVNNDFKIYTEEPTDSLKNMIKTTVKINNVEVPAYQIRENSKDYIIYGRNILTGKSNYYVYDVNEKTLSLFNQEDFNYLLNNNEIYKIISYSAGVLIILLLIIIILQASSKRKMNYLLAKMNEEIKTVEDSAPKTNGKKKPKNS